MGTYIVTNKTMIILLLIIGTISISTSSTTRTHTKNKRNTKEKYTLPLHGIERDTFVQSAPLIIAVSCKDGIAIVAAHPSSSISSLLNNANDNNNDINDVMMDPLLYYRHRDDDTKTTSERTINFNGNDNHEQLVLDVTTEIDDGSIPFIDIPIDFGGPYRINDINENTIILSCGWRADCQSILDYCTSIIDTITTYEYPIWILNQRKRKNSTSIQQDDKSYDKSNVDNNNNKNNNKNNDNNGNSNLIEQIDLDPYRSNSYRIASDISYYMAQCAVSERVRTLSCVTLLISTTSTNHLQQQQQQTHNQKDSNRTVLLSTDLNNTLLPSSSPGTSNNIWFIDSTGAYPVRALCLGGGILSKDIVQQMKNEENDEDYNNIKSTTTATIDSTAGKTEVVLEKEVNYDNDDEEILYVSDYINQRLLQEYFTLHKSSRTIPKSIIKGRRSGTIGFEDLTVVDGLKRIVLILANKYQLLDNDDDDNNIDGKITMKEGAPPMQPPTIPIINKNTRLELAIVRPTSLSSSFTARPHKPAFVRMLLSDLFPQKQ